MQRVHRATRAVTRANTGEREAPALIIGLSNTTTNADGKISAIYQFQSPQLALSCVFSDATLSPICNSVVSFVHHSSSVLRSSNCCGSAAEMLRWYTGRSLQHLPIRRRRTTYALSSGGSRSFERHA